MTRRPVPEPGDFVRRHPDKALGVVTNRAAGRTFVVRWPDGRHVLFRIRHSDGELEQISPPPCDWTIPDLDKLFDSCLAMVQAIDRAREVKP